MATKQLVKIEDQELTISSLDKVLWEDLKITKGQVVEYYAKVASVAWNELQNIQPANFNLFTVPKRLEQIGDLFERVITEPQCLDSVLERIRFFDLTYNI